MGSTRTYTGLQDVFLELERHRVQRGMICACHHQCCERGESGYNFLESIPAVEDTLKQSLIQKRGLSLLDPLQ
ncbi:hypothetical protein M011DRAFT_466965 [Sporormia fimetaria CBS 119925]|uniref:Uncharacterized protein n=1 Tax=Sporormia fimetaria CBS 119925 TaxID=1340428 RepID=A0A6A6VBJ4_9PLEO|nr:hypothetical protein M011DRAFT_466965 [Sporormia fimetaria CBS 119925]